MSGGSFGESPVMRVGVVGCGMVGSAICRSLDARPLEAELHAVHDVDATQVQAVMWTLKRRPQSMSLAGVVATCDMVVEATNPEAAPHILRMALDSGRDVMVTNPAALVGHEDFVGVATERGARIHVPCDILVGLDGLRAAASGEITSAALTVTGPPAFFAGQPAGADVGSPAEAAQVFRGTGADALAALPELANAVAVVAYAGRGFGQTTVVALADPQAEGLTCRVDAAWSEGSFSAESRVALPARGPRASPLVALSATAALRRVIASLAVG